MANASNKFGSRRCLNSNARLLHHNHGVERHGFSGDLRFGIGDHPGQNDRPAALRNALHQTVGARLLLYLVL